MNILLLNAHSPQNAGDLAILQESLACLRAAFPEAALTIAINDPSPAGEPLGARYVASLTRWLVDLSPEGEWRWRKPLALPYAAWLLSAGMLYRISGYRLLPRAAERRALIAAYYDADLVAVIGGGHLYARHALNIAFLWLWLGLALAVLMGKPLVLLPQSFGPLPGALQRRLLRWLLARSALVAAREYHSLRLLAAIGLRRRVLVLPDLAFTAREAPAQALDAAIPGFAALRADGRPLVGLTLMDWGGQNPGFQNQRGYETAVLALVRHLRDRYQARIVLFSQCCGPTAAQDDRRIARRIAAAAGQPDALVLIDAALPPEVLKAAYRQMDALVATRMHSAIFALSSGVPTLAIGYLHKSIGIMEMLGLDRYVLDIDTIDAARACAGFDRLWAERAGIRDRLTTRMPGIRTTLGRLPALIRGSVWDI